MLDLRRGPYGSSAQDPIGYQDNIDWLHNNQNFI